MMNEQVVKRMKEMKLYGMLRSFETSLESDAMNNLTKDEMIAQLIEEEWDDRCCRKIARNMQNAKFHYSASIEQMYFETDRGIDKNQVMRLAECTFIKNKENVMITGSTGIGKSYLASALGQQACTLGYKVLYHNTTKLFAKLKMAKPTGLISMKLRNLNVSSCLFWMILGYNHSMHKPFCIHGNYRRQA